MLIYEYEIAQLLSKCYAHYYISIVPVDNVPSRKQFLQKNFVLIKLIT